MKTFLVTGAYGGIGKAICELLAKDLNHRVILAGRDEQYLLATVEQLKQSTKNSAIQGYQVDFSSKTSIEQFANEIKDEIIDVLINNHATAPRQRQISRDGIEMQFATNVLGYIWMIKAFEKHLKKADGHGRIVNVASYWAGGLDINDLEFRTRSYSPDSAYRQSKQANRMLTYAYAEKFRSQGITVNVCHPGDANTKLSNALGFTGHETPEESAKTPVYLATSNDVASVTGKYFRNCRIENDSFANDRHLIKKLVDICDNY